MEDTTVKHVIRFPAELYAKLRKLAELDDRSINGEVVFAVRSTVEQYEREHGPLVDSPESRQAQ